MIEANKTVENRSDRAAVLQRFMGLARGIEGFEERTVVEMFGADEDDRRELIKKLSAEQYIQLVTGINGILRGKDKTEWTMDGVRVTVAGNEEIGKHIFPHHKDKKDILVRVWEVAQVMLDEGRSLEDVAMLLGSMLVETHPFNDGNGRTSRLIYSMVKSGYSSDEVETILGEDGRDKFDMALIKIYIDQLFEKRYGRSSKNVNRDKVDGLFASEEGTFGALIFPKEISSVTAEALIEGGRNDVRIFIASVLDYANKNKIQLSSFVKHYGSRKILLFQNLLSSLSGEQIDELASAYWTMKKIYTLDMIDIFANPDKLEYRIERDGKEETMLAYFKQRLANGTVLME